MAFMLLSMTFILILSILAAGLTGAMWCCKGTPLKFLSSLATMQGIMALLLAWPAIFIALGNETATAHHDKFHKMKFSFMGLAEVFLDISFLLLLLSTIALLAKMLAICCCKHQKICGECCAPSCSSEGSSSTDEDKKNKSKK